MITKKKQLESKPLSSEKRKMLGDTIIKSCAKNDLLSTAENKEYQRIEKNIKALDVLGMGTMFVHIVLLLKANNN